MQQDELIITSPEQARALQDTGFLGHFLNPASPSEVARRLEITANLAHHHARRHAALGLLYEAGRERGKVYYQLAAKTFKFDRKLLPSAEPDGHTAVTLKQLSERLLAEYERCNLLESDKDPNWHVSSFDRTTSDPWPVAHDSESGQLHPAHFQVRTLKLTPARYRALVRQVAKLVQNAEAEGSSDATTCTLAVLAMDGSVQSGTTDSQYLSTYIPNTEADEAIEASDRPTPNPPPKRQP